jgi:hypothetical protein
MTGRRDGKTEGTWSLKISEISAEFNAAEEKNMAPCRMKRRVVNKKITLYALI